MRIDWWDTHGAPQSCEVSRECEDWDILWRRWGEQLDERFRSKQPEPASDDAIWPGSVHDDLRRLVFLLDQRFRWDEEESIRFVLTGAAPTARLVHVTWWHLQGQDIKDEDILYGCPSITYDPRVPLDKVFRACREMQQWLLDGRENRLASQRNLVLCRFVLPYRQQDSRPTWKSLMARWNETFPNWTYRDWRRLQGDYRRTWQAVVVPHYPPHQGEPNWSKWGPGKP